MNLPLHAPALRRPRPAAPHAGALLLLTLGLLLAAATPPAAAFPPAPFYTLYGIVRDQIGTTLEADGAEIVLLRDNVELGRAPVWKQLNGDKNYELAIRLDHARAATRTYTDRAVAAAGLFSIVVELNGQRFFPIEVSGTLRAGLGGELVRLDLNLGADANRDGLPDAWQEFQLHQAGRRPGQPGWDINLITRDGDFDGDGVSNYLEYIAGTFAGDATERFELRLTGKSATHVAFEFYAITGKFYTIEESTDLRTWTAVPFALAAGGPTTALHRATAVGVLPVYVATGTGPSRFYRLTAR